MHPKVILDIGGTDFVTTDQTLKRIPNLFQDLEPDHNGCIFIDRDPRYFNHILNYLRDGSTSFMDTAHDDTIREISREAKFYKIAELEELCASHWQPPALNDRVKWRADSIDAYWHSSHRRRLSPIAVSLRTQ
ncbi:hypothetical protein L596_000450 [Steinernema carpocapsae]|uniref:BTB domain-containing protein n=1 Tax=Steinernema carpocapsae TaxID=34508 RepID=A0A4V6I6X8_STECR|nr:hypothetical protein L596_000450 [Steinernema carpocapsae]